MTNTALPTDLYADAKGRAYAALGDRDPLVPWTQADVEAAVLKLGRDADALYELREYVLAEQVDDTFTADGWSCDWAYNDPTAQETLSHLEAAVSLAAQDDGYEPTREACAILHAITVAWDLALDSAERGL
jgi:hypothetical protein